MNTENYILKEQVRHLKEMVEWMTEAHGESTTTEYTVDSKPWKLKDYVKECMLEFNEIDFREKEVAKKNNQSVIAIHNLTASTTNQRCACCGNEIKTEPIKIMQHQMHRFVCSEKCMWDFYK